jgi:diguanylate cyclase (GGDEF)-like protein/PAS domain S-box-containing protein
LLFPLAGIFLMRSSINSRLWKFCSFLCASFISSTLLTTAIADDVIQTGRKAPQTITVVSDDNYPPYVFRAEDGSLKGYVVDQWKLWESKTGIHVNLVASDWQKTLATMAAGEADVIDTIFRTSERERIYDFTPPYAELPVPIFVHESINGITDAKSLRGFLVGVKAGDACVGRLQAAGVGTMESFDSYQAIVNAAVSGRIKIFCLDEPPADYLLYRAGADQRFRKAFTLYSGNFHRAVRKGDRASLELVERGFSAITDAEMTALHDKWMGTPLSQFPYGEYLARVVAIFLLAGAVLMTWVYFLRREVSRRTKMLEHERSQLRTLVETIPDPVWIKNLDGVYTACNPAAEKFFGKTAAVVIGKRDDEFVAAELAESFLQKDREVIATGQPVMYEEWVTFPDSGQRAFVETIKTAVRDGSDRVIGVLGIARDITGHKRAEEQIRNLAFFDPLTNLPNRRLLVDRLGQALIASTRSKEYGALLMIDLDNFKALNDTQGHDVGDRLLISVAERLLGCVRSEDTVSRLGGDEYILVLEGLGHDLVTAASQAEIIAEKIFVALNLPYSLGANNRAHHSTPSIGVTLFCGKDIPIEVLLKQADVALYQAKDAGRNSIRFFNPEMQSVIDARAEMESALRTAFHQGGLRLFYQPQVDVQGRLIGAEALLRWPQSEGLPISPAEFIPLAEESGLIIPIGQWVMDTAFVQLKRWQSDPRTRGLKLSINVSAKQFYRPDFVVQVRNCVEQSGADPTLIKLELTESVVLHNVDDVVERMEKIRALGVGFSLDDFGTGYSSLSYLKRLPLDQVKIDQTFVRDVTTDPGDAAIVRATLFIGKALGLQVIAEGVETEAQFEFLKESGCPGYQGYLFGRPLPIDDWEQLLSR